MKERHGFKIGDWVKYKYFNKHTHICYIDDLYDEGAVVYIPEFETTGFVSYSRLKKLENDIHKVDLQAMLDLALMTNDEEWFNKLTN